MEDIQVSTEEAKNILQLIRKKKLSIKLNVEEITKLEEQGLLTKRVAGQVLSQMMKDCSRIRKVVKPVGEMAEEMIRVFQEMDSISDISLKDLDKVYKSIQMCLKFQKTVNMYEKIQDLRAGAIYTINSINSIDRLNISVTPEVKAELDVIKAQLEEVMSGENTDISLTQDCIKRYNGHATAIWNDYLTSPDEGKKNLFRYVLHNITRGEMRGDSTSKRLSASLGTNRIMGLYMAKQKYGLILKPKRIIAADSKDTQTHNYTDDEDEIFISFQPIKLPQEVEEECIQRTIEENGEMLNYDNTQVYSEVVLAEYEIQGIFFVSNGEGELSPEYNLAKKMADDRGIPLKELDLFQCRKDNGLEPISKGEQPEFLRNILKQYCNGNEALEKMYTHLNSQFVSEYYERFYEAYKKLKNEGKCSKEDILGILRPIILEHAAKFWESSGFFNEPYGFSGELSEEELEYIVNSRFDFQKCKTYEEFHDLYCKFSSVVGGVTVSDTVMQYMAKRFGNAENLYKVGENEVFLQELFENKDLNLGNLLEQIQTIRERSDSGDSKKDFIDGESNTEYAGTENVLVEYDEQPKRQGGEEEPAIGDLDLGGSNLRASANLEGNSVSPQSPEINMGTELESLWEKRFKKCYNFISRTSGKLRTNLIKMKKDLLEAIISLVKGRKNPERGKAENREE